MITCPQLKKKKMYKHALELSKEKKTRFFFVEDIATTSL
jgi:hypothetical protein